MHVTHPVEEGRWRPVVLSLLVLLLVAVVSGGAVGLLLSGALKWLLTGFIGG